VTSCSWQFGVNAKNNCPKVVGSCTAAHIVQTLQELHYEVLEYPPYSPDLALSGHVSLDPSKMLQESSNLPATMS